MYICNAGKASDGYEATSSVSLEESKVWFVLVV